MVVMVINEPKADFRLWVFLEADFKFTDRTPSLLVEDLVGFLRNLKLSSDLKHGKDNGCQDD